MAARRGNANTASRPLISAAAANHGGAIPGGARRPIRPSCFRLLSILVIVFLLYLLFFASSPKKPLKTPDPQPVEGQWVRRIVAVGDLHGDYDNALSVLRMADVVDANGSWTGNVDYFVQTGDIIDRGDDTIKLFSWMEKLRQQAREAGGEMFSHLGNHEYMNALADWRYVPQDEIATFGSVAKRQAALSTGPIGSAWAHNYSVASRVPLHPAAGEPFADYKPAAASPLTHAALSFMHGGLSPLFPHATPYPSAINKLGASLLRRCQTQKPQPVPHPPAPYSGLPPGSTVAEADLYGADGPLWYRGWAMDDERAVCSRVDAITEKIGVRRLIMGHTPDFEKIVSRCGGKIIIIDTGISKAYSGALSALSITYTLTPVRPLFNVSSAPNDVQHNFVARDEPTLETEEVEIQAKGMSDEPTLDTEEVEIQAKGKGKWVEREEVVAIYPGRKVQLVTYEKEISGDFW